MVYYKRINTYKIKKNLLLFILIIAVVYLILPFWAGVFNYKITTGPKIYWEDYHFIIYCIGHKFSRQPYDRPTGGRAIFYDRPWFYFMPIKTNPKFKQLHDAAFGEKK